MGLLPDKQHLYSKKVCQSQKKWGFPTFRPIFIPNRGYFSFER